jgi:hypothetical protein
MSGSLKAYEILFKEEQYAINFPTRHYWLQLEFPNLQIHEKSLKLFKRNLKKAFHQNSKTPTTNRKEPMNSKTEKSSKKLMPPSIKFMNDVLTDEIVRKICVKNNFFWFMSFK